MRACTLLFARAAVATAVSPARADVSPAEGIPIVVPYAPAASDVLARLVGTRMEAAFRQPVTVEHKPGAIGTIAQQFVAAARPDGYTLLLGITSTQVVDAHLYTKLNFSIAKAFAPIGLIASSPMIPAVSPSSPSTASPTCWRRRGPRRRRSMSAPPATDRRRTCRSSCSRRRPGSR
jgi:tripartite-type tricarboxylate transporter receptor subunit TctC